MMKNFKATVAAACVLALASSASAKDCSITLTAGTTAQPMIPTPAGGQRINGFVACNIDPTTGSGEAAWINVNGAAAIGAVGSIPLSVPTAATYVGMGCYTTPDTWSSSNAVSVNATTTGHKISCWYW